MLQFYSGQFLNLLWLTPILAFCFVASAWLQNKRTRAFFKTSEIQGKLLTHYEKTEWPFRATLLLAAFIFAVIALSQPQWGEEKKKIERKGVDLIFMLDVSTSMLAEDIKPSRVRKAKFEIEAFVKELKGDRVGMLTFAGSSFMQTPLTLDYSAFLIFLSGVDVGHVPDPGTSLGPAIQKAIEAFPDEKGKHRALIVFSDGEDHDQRLDPAIEEAKKKNVRIYTVGTASAEGAPIPLKDEQGQQIAVKKDRLGSIVITKLNKDLLSKVSKETGGLYLPATPGEKEVELILKHLETLGEKKLEDRVVTEREDHYQIFVFLTLLCLMLEMLVRRNKLTTKMPASLFLIFFFLHSGFISTPQKKVDEGNEDYEGKRYQSAVQKYREVQVKNPDSPPVEYNLATSLYKIDQFQESAAHLKTAVAKSSQDPELQAKAAYNYGNALYRVGDYEGAIAAYKKALELNPKDQDSKYNLEFIQDKKNKFEKENQDRKKDNQQQNQQNKNQNNDQKNQGDNSNQDKNQNSGNENQQNQGGGGGSNSDQNQGQDNQKNQQGSGKDNQNNNQNQNGQGENQKNSGQNQNPDQKDQGQGENQKNQDQQQNNQSGNDAKDQGKGGGQGEEQKNESQGQDKNKQNDQKDKQDQQDQKNQDQQQDPQNKDQSQAGQQPNQNNQQQNSGENQKDQPKPQDSGQEPDQNQNPGQPSDQQGSGQQNQNAQQPPQQPQQGQGGQGASGQPEPSQEKPDQQGQSGSGTPLQGQMSQQDAEYLLGSLEEGEKKFHVQRKPGKENNEPNYVEKDW